MNINLPSWHVSPSNPVPVQSQLNVPGVLLQVPVLQGLVGLHSLISTTTRDVILLLGLCISSSEHFRTRMTPYLDTTRAY